MKTTFDQETLLYTLLNNSALRDALTGGIYKQMRPDSSRREDVVILSLPLTHEPGIDRGTVNVNVYVPNLLVNLEGQTQQMPDMLRLSTLTQLVLPLLSVYGTDYALYVTAQTLLAEEQTDSHYVNIRVSTNFYTS